MKLEDKIKMQFVNKNKINIIKHDAESFTVITTKSLTVFFCTYTVIIGPAHFVKALPFCFLLFSLFSKMSLNPIDQKCYQNNRDI